MSTAYTATMRSPSVSIVGLAESPPRCGRIDVAGPEIADALELARTWRSITGRRARTLPVPLPGKLGRALRAGALTAERPDVRGTTTFATWLKAEQCVLSGR